MQFRWMQGMVRLEITGLGVDSLLAEACRGGLVFYDLKRPGRTLALASMSLRHGRQLMKLAEARGLEIYVRGSWGLPSLWLRMLARPTLAMAMVIGFLLLLLAADRVWEVRIVGTQGAEARAIQHFLAGEGLNFGAAADEQNINVLEYKTRQAFPQLQFVGIRLAGVRATVTVAHAVQADTATAAQGSAVVASRAGMIVRVTPRRGTPRVKPGDVVARGQMLIEGIMEYPEGDEREPRSVEAAGEVIARIWVNGQASAALTKVDVNPEGAVAQEWTLIIGGKRIPLSLGRRQGDMLLESVEAWRLPGFAAAAPIALEKRQYRQGVMTASDYETTLDTLRSQSGAEALRLLPENAQVKGRTEKISVQEGMITVTTQLEALCDIGEKEE